MMRRIPQPGERIYRARHNALTGKLEVHTYDADRQAGQSPRGFFAHDHSAGGVRVHFRPDLSVYFFSPEEAVAYVTGPLAP